MKIIKPAFLLLVISLCGCGKKNPPPSPSKASLVFPNQNAVCTTGSVISATESTIQFTWNSSLNTDSYELDIKNLLTGVTSTHITTINKASVTLLRNTPYSWFVVSKSNSVSAVAQSDAWKFYNAGAGTVSYAPFPASLTSPLFGQSITGTTVNLSWEGSDVDNDIVSYILYFSSDANPALFKSGITDMFLKNVTISSGTTYYWKVITVDSQGNKSDSEIFEFNVQ